MTQFAIWLDTVFASFDSAILSFWHSAALAADTVLTPIMELISITGEKGLGMILLGLILVCFAKTRKAGICIIGAICFGALITNITLKPLIARARPYESSLVFREFWEFVGAHIESDLSFPSGHATATTAAMVALTLTKGKKLLWVSVPYIILMCASRNYLMVHYPTDVIVGVIAGSIGAIASFFVTRAIYARLSEHPEGKFSSFVLNSGISDIFARKKASN